MNKAVPVREKQTPSRRAVLTASTSALAVAPTSATAGTVLWVAHADAELFRLIDELDAAEVAFHAVLNDLSVVEKALQASGATCKTCTPELRLRLDEESAREDQASDVASAALDRVIETPAKTAEGLRRKAKIAARNADCPYIEPGLAASIIRDVLTLIA